MFEHSWNSCIEGGEADDISCFSIYRSATLTAWYRISITRCVLAASHLLVYCMTKSILQANSLQEVERLSSHSRWDIVAGKNGPLDFWWPTWHEITLVCCSSQFVCVPAHKQAKYCCDWCCSALPDPIRCAVHEALQVDLKFTAYCRIDFLPSLNCCV